MDELTIHPEPRRRPGGAAHAPSARGSEQQEAAESSAVQTGQPLCAPALPLYRPVTRGAFPSLFRSTASAKGTTTIPAPTRGTEPIAGHRNRLCRLRGEGTSRKDTELLAGLDKSALRPGGDRAARVLPEEPAGRRVGVR